jgi:protein-S-isoprenylcysteine O-methyltransferase Ste14
MKTSNFNKSKGPGVYIPPPLIYIITFLAAIFIQKIIPINNQIFHSKLIKYLGVVLIITALFFLIRSLMQFFLTKNTVILIKPATSLQTTGIYGITRNPMYVGLLLIYLGITCFIGNWWNIILLPLLIFTIQEYVIKKEERYLKIEFDEEYEKYKASVRRWL